MTASASSPGGDALLGAAYEGVHLVGGAVRDLLRAERPRELDVLVEGPIEPLLSALGGEAVTHDRFGTASVSLGDARIDVARARRERYPHPGALPVVEPASVAEDLLRRDFTVNAIAVSLTDAQMRSAPHAEEDIARGVLRVLHDGSFRDDPTRLLRLARYAARLGFEVDDRTAELAEEARATGTLRTASGARLGAELRLALLEPDPVAALGELSRLGLLSALDPRLGFEESLARRALALLPEDARIDLLLLACVLLPAATAGGGEDSAQAVFGLLDELEFTAGDRDRAIRTTRLAPALLAQMADADSPSQLREAVHGAPLEAVALAGSLDGAQPPSRACTAARSWLEELRHVHLAITGDDLLSAGVPAGPEIGRRLELALRRKLDGELAEGRAAELGAAMEQR
ncbi:MAG: CCA tRNA nucleotidyltransferase [Solirubrobacterales bacterium]